MKVTEEWVERANDSLAQGFPGTNSKRHTHFIDGIYPSHVVSGNACYLTDAWGNKYIDFISGLGVNILGYNHPKVTESIRDAASKGASHSLPHILEVQVAEKIQTLIPAAERIRFLKTGNEATLAAIRIARAASGDYEILSAGYHGHGDSWTSLTAPHLGVPDSLTLKMTQFKDIDDMIIKASDTYIKWCAGIILEPVELELNDHRKSELNRLFEFAKAKQDIPIIFDEIVTGFRVPRFTISNYFSLKPHIITLGKAIANGMPLAVVAGKADIMNDSDYFVSSTYSGEILSLAAALATMTEIEQKSLHDLNFYGSKLIKNLNKLHPSIQFVGYGTRAQLDITTDASQLFMQEMCKSGVLIGKAFYYNFAHLEEGIDERVMNIANDVVGKITRNEVKLEGKPPETSFKR